MAIQFQSGVELKPHQVVLRPLVTEKGTHLSQAQNTYTFAVHPLATKDDIRAAVEELWNVRVAHVRTQNRVGKSRRHKLSRGQTKAWKKALIRLHDDDRISFF